MLSHKTGRSNQGFGFLDMFMTEEKLTIEIAQVDRVQIHNMNFSKPRKH